MIDSIVKTMLLNVINLCYATMIKVFISVIEQLLTVLALNILFELPFQG